MNVAVLFGGKSSEHEVSLVSAASVARNLDKTKYKITLIGITKDGRWFLQDEDELNRICNDEKAAFKITEAKENQVSILPFGKEAAFSVNGKPLNIEMVFPVVHGTYCEDGKLQGLLECADVPYVGCGVMSSAVSMDKEKTKQIWEQEGLPVVPYYCMKRAELNDTKKYDATFEKIIKDFGFPLFVKPCNAGSSVGAGKANNAKEFSMALMEAFLWDNKVLIEKAVNAREIECSVTGNAEITADEKAAGNVRAYTPGEIVPTHEFYDYDAKYNDPDGAALKIPANLDSEKIKEVQEIAKKAYSALDASGLSRVDFFIDKDSGKLYLNEINTLPGFTSISMFPKMCDAAGLKYKELLDLLIEEAKEKYSNNKTIQTSR